MEQPTRGMKKKTISKTINAKIKDWLDSIDKDKQELKDKIYQNIVVTGGAITSMLLGNMPNDYDVYFTDKSVAIEVAKYYLSKLPKAKNPLIGDVLVHETDHGIEVGIRSVGILADDIDTGNYQYFELQPIDSAEKYFEKWAFTKNEKQPYKVAHITSNAITLYDDIQIILRFVGQPSEIHDNFDFIHCSNYWTVKDGVVLNQEALEATLAKELKYSGSKYPICSLFRLRKFIKRGWSITAGEIFKIAYDINKLDLDDIAVLRDQLVGVDSAYFNEVLWILKDDVKNGKTIDRTYLFELINRTFEDDM